jgi:hypothetical protein
MHQPLTPAEKLFAQNFIRDFSAPYAIQQPTGYRRDWRTKHRPLSDPPIHAHLNGDYWLATKAAWYPVFHNLDIDHPDSERTQRIFDRLDQHGIGEHQRAIMTTPSYNKSGNFRIYLRLEYKERQATWRLGNETLTRAFADLAEIYPQRRRKDRLPCGRRQDLISETTGQVLSNLTWEQELHFLLKLDPTPIEKLPRQQTLFEPELIAKDDARTWTPRGDVAELIQHGLQQHGTRAAAQFEILNFLWRSNWQPADAARFVKKWIQARHNGFSTEVNRGRRHEIDRHIEAQVGSIWERPLLPDTPHGLDAAITRADLELAARAFHGDVVRQKQFINLAAYYRPRSRHEYVFIPAHVWRESIASVRTYQSFIADLESKGLLQSNRHYRVGEHSRRFKLNLPTTSEPPLQRDSRHVSDFYEALALAYSRRDLIALTGINERTIRRHFADKRHTII